MNATPTSRVDVQLVMFNGTTTDVKSVELFRGLGMIWVRGHEYAEGSVVEVVINGRHHTVRAVRNKSQVCEIRFEWE